VRARVRERELMMSADNRIFFSFALFSLSLLPFQSVSMIFSACSLAYSHSLHLPR